MTTAPRHLAPRITPLDMLAAYLRSRRFRVLCRKFEVAARRKRVQAAFLALLIVDSVALGYIVWASVWAVAP